MNSIAFDVQNEKHFSARIQEFFRRYQISCILKKSNAYKEQGVSVVALIQYLFCLVFRNRSMFLDMGSKSAPSFAKDTVYRLRNSTRVDWKRFTTANQLIISAYNEAAGNPEKQFENVVGSLLGLRLFIESLNQFSIN